MIKEIISNAQKKGIKLTEAQIKEKVHENEQKELCAKIPELKNKSIANVLEKPVDISMIKALFVQDDPLLKFYESKYKFEPKDIRPFA